jgi:hypothetical protein
MEKLTTVQQAMEWIKKENLFGIVVVDDNTIMVDNIKYTGRKLVARVNKIRKAIQQHDA